MEPNIVAPIEIVRIAAWERFPWLRHGFSYRPGDDLGADPIHFIVRGRFDLMPNRPTSCPDPATTGSFLPRLDWQKLTFWSQIALAFTGDGGLALRSPPMPYPAQPV